MAISALSLVDILDLSVEITVVDVGANPIDGDPLYRPLLVNGIARVIGFEPNPAALRELLSKKGPHETYLPYAIGDGKPHTMHFCMAPGMTSLLPPNPSVLKHFHGFSEWGKVTHTEQCETIALDDVEEIADADLLKLDIQGAELMALQNAPRLLKRCVAIHTEVEFLPMYIGQPMFSEIEQHLRAAGFLLHKFDQVTTRAVAPMVVRNDLYGGINQILWADAIFIRDFMDPAGLSDEKLLKLCVILHDIHKSFDIVLRLLYVYDERHNTNFADRYLAALG